ncbi:MAG: hypothetical protein K9J17_04865 [Flavobacteriales bacterium]|nr:hypothetical protein [Flavobacteriales bacterium]
MSYRIHYSRAEARRLNDYDYAKYKDCTSQGLGFDTKVEELGQFFTVGGSRSTDDSAPQS